MKWLLENAERSAAALEGGVRAASARLSGEKLGRFALLLTLLGQLVAEFRRVADLFSKDDDEQEDTPHDTPPR